MTQGEHMVGDGLISNCGNCGGTMLGVVRVVIALPGGDYALCARCLGSDAVKPACSPELVAEVLRHIDEIRNTGSIQRPATGKRQRRKEIE
jgi:hypothetical protein